MYTMIEKIKGEINFKRGRKKLFDSSLQILSKNDYQKGVHNGIVTAHKHLSKVNMKKYLLIFFHLNIFILPITFFTLTNYPIQFEVYMINCTTVLKGYI